MIVYETMIEYTHDGMVIKSHIFYRISCGRRVFFDKRPAESERTTYFEFEGDMFPPQLMIPTAWSRYGYTSEDVVTTYSTCDASCVWGLALMLLRGRYEPEASSAGVRPTFQSLFTFSFIARKPVFGEFIRLHRSYISNRTQSVLCTERSDHTPLLPKVFVDRRTWAAARSLISAKPPSFAHKVTYHHKFRFKDIWLVPVEFDSVNQLVYMVRVVRRAVYDDIPVKPKYCVVTMPVVCEINGEEWVLTEEACFAACEPSPKRKRGRGLNAVEAGAAVSKQKTKHGI